MTSVALVDLPQIAGGFVKNLPLRLTWIGRPARIGRGTEELMKLALEL